MRRAMTAVLPPNWQSAMSHCVASLMISSSSFWNVRLMAAKTSSLDVCLAGPKIAGSLQESSEHQATKMTKSHATDRSSHSRGHQATEHDPA